MTIVRSFTLAALLLVAGAASAQGCAGFTDVADDGSGSTAFCPSVTWLKNRAITLGCTSTTQFCPNNPVTRLQMAAFMHRLGNALAPQVFGVENSGTGLGLSSPQVICETTDITTEFRRSWIVLGSVTAKGAPDGDVTVQPVVSLDGGASYSPLNNLGRKFSVRTPVWNGTSVMKYVPTTGAFLLSPSSTYRFGLRVERDGGAADISAFQCHIVVELRGGTGADLP